MKQNNNKSLWFGQYKRLYDGQRWRKIAKMHLDSSPLCIPCLKRNIETPATIVHHKIPHEGNVELFYDMGNLESVCATCHSGVLRIAENHGYSQACGVDGDPTDPNHPWNKNRIGV